MPGELPPDERALEMGIAYLEFARRNPEDVSIIAMHESMIHMLPLSPEHRRFEESRPGVFKEGVATRCVQAANEQDADYMAYGAWALVQGLATFEQQQRPELLQGAARQAAAAAAGVRQWLKSDWSASATESPVT